MVLIAIPGVPRDEVCHHCWDLGPGGICEEHAVVRRIEEELPEIIVEASPEEIESFREYWNREIAGRDHVVFTPSPESARAERAWGVGVVHQRDSSWGSLVVWSAVLVVVLVLVAVVAL